MRINGKAATIVGVMPANFKFPQAEELWVSLYNEVIPPKKLLREDPAARDNSPGIIGRLKPNVTLDQANAEFVGIARHLA